MCNLIWYSVSKNPLTATVLILLTLFLHKLRVDIFCILFTLCTMYTSTCCSDIELSNITLANKVSIRQIRTSCGHAFYTEFVQSTRAERDLMSFGIHFRISCLISVFFHYFFCLQYFSFLIYFSNIFTRRYPLNQEPRRNKSLY